jgi:hypothetical protein
MQGSTLSVFEDDNEKSCQTYDDNPHLPDDRELHKNITFINMDTMERKIIYLGHG